MKNAKTARLLELQETHDTLLSVYKKLRGLRYGNHTARSCSFMNLNKELMVIVSNVSREIRLLNESNSQGRLDLINNSKAHWQNYAKDLRDAEFDGLVCSECSEPTVTGFGRTWCISAECEFGDNNFATSFTIKY